MVRVRIPPSPTGWLHIGTARTALFNYLFARHHQGQIVFRSEDTDKERSKPEYEKDIIDGLHLLGMDWDEGPFRQSERSGIYKKYLETLVAKDAAYYCFCSKEDLERRKAEQMAKKFAPRYEGTCSKLNPEESRKRVEAGESAVIRLRVAQDQDLRFKDLIRGETVILSKELDDFVIARKIDDCLYNFTVVIDDHDMEITHVIRGEDHISNTPKQILIYRAFGWDIPEFAHLPLILNEDKTKMSKRKNKVSLNEYLAEGYLPEALINFLALLGWNPGEGETNEIFSMKDLIERFDLSRVHKGGAIFDIKKLGWFNGYYLQKQLDEKPEKFLDSLLKLSWLLKNPEEWKKFLGNNKSLIISILKNPDFKGRCQTLSETLEALSVFLAIPDYDKKLILNEKFKIELENTKAVFKNAISAIDKIDWERGDSAKTQTLSDAMTGLVAALGLKNGQVLWPIRVALSGAEKSPNFATLMVYLGKEETLKRLELALKKL